ncbi:universal stress protein [Novosphingobium sp. M1R2S20]|uniref:Universal stress protein n=1 Tax=Novosphingobium rhizovicinum TaxID=3228928 RepID=A0ABV3REF2_9SPHN
MTVPTTILFPTDFAGRCDRPRERAALLAREWGGRLVLLHVLSGESANLVVLEEATGRAEASLREEVRGEGFEVATKVATGDVAQAVLEAATQFEADVIVTGLSRRDGLSDYLVGSTVERVARSSRLPVLVVKEQSAAEYRRIAVATDFSTSSTEALRVALATFPRATFSLVHAYHVRWEAIRGRDEPAAAQQAEIADELDRFLASFPPALRERLDVTVDYGDECRVVSDHVQVNGIDLAVVGTRGRSGLVAAVLGSTARALVECLDCDVLLVPQRSDDE